MKLTIQYRVAFKLQTEVAMSIVLPVWPPWWVDGISDADDDVTNMAAAGENGDSAGCWMSADSISGGSRRESAYMRSRWCQNCCCCCCCRCWCGTSSQCGATCRAPVKKIWPISASAYRPTGRGLTGIGNHLGPYNLTSFANGVLSVH